MPCWTITLLLPSDHAPPVKARTVAWKAAFHRTSHEHRKAIVSRGAASNEMRNKFEFGRKLQRLPMIPLHPGRNEIGRENTTKRMIRRRTPDFLRCIYWAMK